MIVEYIHLHPMFWSVLGITTWTASLADLPPLYSVRCLGGWPTVGLVGQVGLVKWVWFHSTISSLLRLYWISPFLRDAHFFSSFYFHKKNDLSWSCPLGSNYCPTILQICSRRERWRDRVEIRFSEVIFKSFALHSFVLFRVNYVTRCIWSC